jgi:hypothetical protein
MVDPQWAMLSKMTACIIGCAFGVFASWLGSKIAERRQSSEQPGDVDLARVCEFARGCGEEIAQLKSRIRELEDTIANSSSKVVAQPYESFYASTEEMPNGH